jgi:hypothetical protein
VSLVADAFFREPESGFGGGARLVAGVAEVFCRTLNEEGKYFTAAMPSSHAN